jgi:hypothetical protein
MAQTSTETFTVGVFQDHEWARRGIQALVGDGFTPAELSVIAKTSPEVAAIVEETLGAAPSAVDLRALGPGLALGPLVAVLQGADSALAVKGIGGTMTRAGFQRHDGYIFETLIGRGGVLVAVRDERRAADALATLHAYGGGNAAIGAWTGRV